MTVAIIAGDMKFGPWIMPHRAQNAVSNSYAAMKGIEVDTIIPEPIFSNLFDTTLWVCENWNLSGIIMCSILQLPDQDADIQRFTDKMADIDIHFALEGLSGKGRIFLNDVFFEARQFRETDIIDLSSVHTYNDLQRMLSF